MINSTILSRGRREVEETIGSTEQNGWKDSFEAVLLKYGERAAARAFLHMKANKYYTKINNHLSYPSIVLTTVCGFAGALIAFGNQSNVTECNQCENFVQEFTFLYLQYSLNATTAERLKTILQEPRGGNNGVSIDAVTVFVLQITISFFTLMAALLNSIQRFLKSSELAEAHYNAHLSFSRLKRDVNLELSLDKQEREHGLVYLSAFRTNLENLYQSTPGSFPDSILQEFAKRFPNIENKPEVVLEVMEDTKDIIRLETIHGQPQRLNSRSRNVSSYQTVKEYIKKKCTRKEHPEDHSIRTQSPNSTVVSPHSILTPSYSISEDPSEEHSEELRQAERQDSDIFSHQVSRTKNNSP